MIKLIKPLRVAIKDKVLQSIFLTQFLSSLAWYISTPFIAIYLTTQLKASAYQAGLFVSVGMLSYSLSSPIVGKAIDSKYGKLVIYTSSVMLITSFLSFYFINNLVFFYLASMMIGIGRAGFSTLINWSISNAVESHLKKITFSLRYSVINIGSAIGPLISSILIKDIQTMFLVSFLFMFISTVTIIPCTNTQCVEEVVFTKQPQEFSHAKRLSVLVIGLILFDICFSQMTVLFPLSIKHAISNWQTVYAMLFTINAVLVIFAQVLVTKLTNLLGDVKSIVLGTTLLSVSFVLFSISFTSLGYYISISLFTLSELVILPLSYVWLDNIAPTTKKGTYFGVYNLSFLGSAIGPVLGGAGVDSLGFDNLYLLLSIVPMLMGICFLISINGLKKINDKDLVNTCNQT